MSKINDTLEERGNRYGDFTDHAAVSQNLKETMRMHEQWEGLPTTHKEALDMIQHKIGRILNGDPNYEDNWHDIAGYAMLSEERCALIERESRSVIAAPELLEALKFTYEMLKKSGIGKIHLKPAEEAIAKAEGKT